MRRVIATVVGTLVALVLLLSFKTHPLASSAVRPPAVVTPASTAAPAPTASAAAQAPPSAGPSVAAPTTAAPTKPTATPAKPAAVRTIAGDAVDTRYGPVQVQVSLKGSTMTAITMLQIPDQQRRDIEINNYAVPILTAEALQAQSVQIDMVSGATYTSEGYLQSLQSALDKAKTS